ncbi:MAG: substrate-binding domain-containing protein [Nevskia sp.]|nr:substrate-binding domain-containing protein [Nevskia sp.]
MSDPLHIPAQSTVRAGATRQPDAWRGLRARTRSSPLRHLHALLLLLFACAAGAPARAADTQVILSPDRANTPVSRDMLRAIFTTRLRQWPDGTPIRVFVLPDDHPLHDQFCREHLGMYPYVLREIWDRLQFTGTGLAPTQVYSENEMRSRVRSTPGAIGYLSAGEAQNPAVSLRAAPDRPAK